MPFELRVDFTGLIAFVSNTKDPDDATMWNAVLVDPTAGGTVDMEPHYPMLVVPAASLVDELPDDLKIYRALPPSGGVEHIGLLINRLKLWFDPLQTGLNAQMDLVADLELAIGKDYPGAGQVRKNIVDTVANVEPVVGTIVELQGGQLYGDQSAFMLDKVFNFPDDDDFVSNEDYESGLCDRVRLFQFRLESDLTIKLKGLSPGSTLDHDLKLEPMDGKLTLGIANLPLDSTFDEGYHRHHFKHYYDLSAVDVPPEKRCTPAEIEGGDQSGKLVFCISGLMYE